MLERVARYTTDNAQLLLREPASVFERYSIENRWSDALQTYYSALYRTRGELIRIVEGFGFELEVDDDMFEDGSPLNKWDETRLRVYLFRKRKKN